jgi:hypothetical protein
MTCKSLDLVLQIHIESFFQFPWSGAIVFPSVLLREKCKYWKLPNSGTVETRYASFLARSFVEPSFETCLVELW